MQTLAIFNQKGGVGKTTTAVHLSFALARAGKMVLLVDLDPQASLTEYFGVNTYDGNLETTYELLTQRRNIKPVRVSDNIDLMASHILLSKAEIELQTKINKEGILKKVLLNYPQYDFCLIDCPPSLGVLPIIALTAAERVLIPVATELMPARTIKFTMDTIDEVITNSNPGLKIWHIILTRHSSTKIDNRESKDIMLEAFGEYIYQDEVKDTVKYRTAVKYRADIAVLDHEQGLFWDKLANNLVEAGVVYE
jgi:chromosome partitioning protein